MPTPRDLPTPSDYGFSSALFPSYRKGQLETARSIASSPHRFTLLSAPPGAGKSLIYMTVAQILNIETNPTCRTLVLVGTKGLQEQLIHDFSPQGMVDIRGHGNYPCGVRGGGFGPRNLIPSKSQDRREGCVRPDDCDYQRALSDALAAPIVISNYSYWLTLERLMRPGQLGKFDLLILDEAHTAHDWLADFCAFYLADEDVDELLGILPVEDGEDFVEWAEAAVLVAEDVYKEAAEEERDEKEMKDLEALHRNLSGMIATSKSHEIQWLIKRDRHGVHLSPPWARPYAEQYLFRNTPRVLLSSATLTRDTARHLGIKEFDMFDLPSSFHPSNRPIIWVPTTRVDYKINEGQIRMLMNRIDTVVGARGDRKGLIQCQSYKWMEEVRRRTRHRTRMIFHGRGESRKAVEEFIRMPEESGVVLVSPAVKEGFDFKGDLCRYQIILKVPWVYGKDPVIKARSKTDKGYTTYLAAQDFLQMAGRVVRSGEDRGETFIFDDHWSYFQNKAGFPEWFKKAFRTENQVPKPMRLDKGRR